MKPLHATYLDGCLFVRVEEDPRAIRRLLSQCCRVENVCADHVGGTLLKVRPKTAEERRTLYLLLRDKLTRSNEQQLRTRSRDMKCYVIPPVAHLDLMHSGDRYFCLAHLYLSNKKYRQFFLEQRKHAGSFITLDNSAAERKLVTTKELLRVVAELLPDEVIAPDHLFEKEKTLASMGAFQSAMAAVGLLGKVKIFGCPQGVTQRDWLDCYTAMLRDPWVDVLGLSKISVPKCWGGVTKADQGIAEARRICVAYLDRHDMLRKPVHFLGMGDPHEFQVYQNIMLRSTDSCYTVLAAMNGIDLSKKSKRVPTPESYFNSKLSLDQIHLVQQNIAFLKRCLGA